MAQKDVYPAVRVPHDDFMVIYEILRKVNHPYTHDDAGEIVMGEAAAWEIVKRLAEEQSVTHTADQP